MNTAHPACYTEEKKGRRRALIDNDHLRHPVSTIYSAPLTVHHSLVLYVCYCTACLKCKYHFRVLSNSRTF